MSAVPRPTMSISTNESASRTSPEKMKVARDEGVELRPTSGIVIASTMPAGSSTAPACDGGSDNAICMNTGSR